jgi:hypothetical protein
VSGKSSISAVVAPPLLNHLGVARTGVRGAHDEELGTRVARFDAPHRVLVDPNGIPRLEVPDLVLDLHPRAAADEDVDLLLVLVLVAERQPESGRHSAIADTRVLEAQRDAGHPELEVRRKAEVRCLIVGVLEVEMGVIAHDLDCNAARVEVMKELLL